MLDDGAIGRGDPSVRNHFRDSVSDTMRITDLAAPRKIPPGTGWRKFVYSVSFHKINPGESPRERHYRNLQGRIRRHIRRQYVITVVSGKGGVGVTTMAACIGGVFRECRPENVIAIDAVPSFGIPAGAAGGGLPQGAGGYHELVSRSTVILNHTDSITDKDALALPDRTFYQGRCNRGSNAVRSAPGQRRDH